MATETDEIYQQFETSGELTAEQAARLLELADEGDTGGDTPEPGGEPDATLDAEPASQAVDGGEGDAGQAQEPDESELNADNAVIQAKDGKHTIAFQKLVDAREAAATSKQQAAQLQEQLDAANAEMDKLRAAAQERADNGEAPTGQDKLLDAAQQAMDAGIDPNIFGDFSEEALVKGIGSLMQEKLTGLDKAFNDRLAELEKRFEPIQQKGELAAQEQHFKTILEAHPDADSLVESKELDDWINARPGAVRAAYRDVLDNGTAKDVVELFDDFKQATGKSQAAPGDAQEGDVRDKAKAAIANVKPSVPASLSDIPGGKPGPGSRTEALASMSPADRLEAMEDMSPEQIEAYLNRSL